MIREQSSSGGVFSVIAEGFLDKRGVVYGVAMTKDCYSAEFARITDKEDLSRIRGSKYLQAKFLCQKKELKQSFLYTLA